MTYLNRCPYDILRNRHFIFKNSIGIDVQKNGFQFFILAGRLPEPSSTGDDHWFIYKWQLSHFWREWDFSGGSGGSGG